MQDSNKSVDRTKNKICVLDTGAPNTCTALSLRRESETLKERKELGNTFIRPSQAERNLVAPKSVANALKKEQKASTEINDN